MGQKNIFEQNAVNDFSASILGPQVI